MSTVNLDIRDEHQINVKATHGKDASFTISGFATLDTAYTLTLTKKGGSHSVSLSVGSGITLVDSTTKTLTVSLNTSDSYEAGTYEGILQSASSSVFFKAEVNIEFSQVYQ